MEKMHRLSAMLKTAIQLFARYPAIRGVHPEVFDRLGTVSGDLDGAPVLTMQLVHDRFYFVLFGAIRVQLHAAMTCRANVVDVRSINGAIGTGWLAELRRSSVAAWLFSRPWIRAYGSLIQGVAYHSASCAQPIRDFKDWTKSKVLWHALQERRGILSLRMGGIEVADLLVDSYLRFRPAPAFDVNDPFVRRLIWQALRDVRRADTYFSEQRPRWYFSSYSTYLEHGIAARVALKNGVPVWTFASFNHFGKKLSESDTFHTADFSWYRARFETLESQEEKLREAQTMLDERLSGRIDAATSYMRRSAYGQTGAILPSGLAGSVVIFLHDFYDSPHVYPDLVFQDFWSWVCFTIEELHQNGTSFFLKPHPNQIALSDQVLATLRVRYPYLKWIESDVSNVQLVQAGIVCGVTVYGTVAHELAYLGVPSICCARHPHHAFQFCRTARNPEEYAKLLQSFDLLPLAKPEMQRQALAFYYMHNLYGSAQDLALRNAFIFLWRISGKPDTSEKEIKAAVSNLVHLPGFSRFISSLLDETMETGLGLQAKD